MVLHKAKSYDVATCLQWWETLMIGQSHHDRIYHYTCRLAKDFLRSVRFFLMYFPQALLLHDIRNISCLMSTKLCCLVITIALYNFVSFRVDCSHRDFELFQHRTYSWFDFYRYWGSRALFLTFCLSHRWCCNHRPCHRIHSTCTASLNSCTVAFSFISTHWWFVPCFWLSPSSKMNRLQYNNWGCKNECNHYRCISYLSLDYDVDSWIEFPINQQKPKYIRSISIYYNLKWWRTRVHLVPPIVVRFEIFLSSLKYDMAKSGITDQLLYETSKGYVETEPRQYK